MTAKYLVTGASGQLGQRVLHHLLETSGVEPSDIIAASRKPDTLIEWAQKGVAVRRVDFDDAASMEDAFAEAERVLLISTDALDRPGIRLVQHRAAIAAAEKAGVKHLLYTSMPEPANSPLLFAPDHEGTESALTASSIPGWTILRNNWYFENLYMSASTVLASGQWYSAAGEGRVAHIAREDIARATAAALASKSDDRKIYTLTGASSYTHRDMAEIIGKATGKDIAVIDVPVEALVQGMVGAGLPDPVARVYASIDTMIGVGGLATITSDFQTLTGVEPLAFEAWIDSQADTLKSMVK
ncbi:SDR family oxidoreductase [Phyllobacterium zundukense]|uniref:NAD(P)-dependent oxidoreductase n=1 Tax=Phyllobacterium zundukense TaxID=1867719 RepID=A0A2N9VYZ0_9HYPH|nr:SDR family oxidoreductase [Phyllobacterium zundukense]ATU95499.1 NAD(P)-dependent oxidoreductase [Phyllobacterium zundukense]PIO44708.1 NAD(P)-dependent oxidoreductase [Phyllobacterium zundukense]